MASEEGDADASEQVPQEPPWKACLGQKEAADLDNALFFDYEFSIDQLMEIAGLCVAEVNTLCVCVCVQAASNNLFWPYADSV